MLCAISALCLIEASPRQVFPGYVKLNGVVVWQAFGQVQVNGANVMIVDPSGCTLQEWHNFDTYEERDAAARLRDYLQGLSDGTVLVSVTDDDASLFLGDALETLSALGADVSDVRLRGAWVFVAEKGDPSKTVFDKQLTEATASNARQLHINVTFGRCDHTVAECVKDGSVSQWKCEKFDPHSPKNPKTDGHQNLHW